MCAGGQSLAPSCWDDSFSLDFVAAAPSAGSQETARSSLRPKGVRTQDGSGRASSRHPCGLTFHEKRGMSRGEGTEAEIHPLHGGACLLGLASLSHKPLTVS